MGIASTIAGCPLVKETDLGRSALERLLDKGGVAQDFGVLGLDPGTRGLTLVTLHPGATVEGAREVAGSDPRVAENVTITQSPTDEQLQEVRGLHTWTSARGGEMS